MNRRFWHNSGDHAASTEIELFNIIAFIIDKLSTYSQGLRSIILSKLYLVNHTITSNSMGYSMYNNKIYRKLPNEITNYFKEKTPDNIEQNAQCEYLMCILAYFMGKSKKNEIMCETEDLIKSGFGIYD